MRVPSVSKVNTRQQQNPHTSQNTVNAVTGKPSAGNSFGECLKSYYQQRDSQKKSRLPEYKKEETTAQDNNTELEPAESESKHIDIRR